MRSGERKPGRGMVKGCTRPTRGGVAGSAGRRESAGNVIRILGAVVIRDVTRSAIRRCALVASSGVTLLAGERRVQTGQSKTCDGGVIKLRSLPTRHRVTGGAGCRKSSGNVVGRFCRVEIRLVTSDAGARRTLEFAADVALRAIQRGVSSAQRESRSLQVIELSTLPGIE